jgi:serine/threonine protein kinase/tetratricopeptide (TPR) repeat protein
MAAVYAGVHRNGHPVAIKILHERLSFDPEIDRRFRREAHLANRVKHPGAVPVIDDDVAEDGCVFLVMPLLEGETLRARTARCHGRLPLGEVAGVVCGMLDILGAAHNDGVVHCDVKPENVFLTRQGSVRVLDFGIARFLASSGSASATKTGSWAGTPAFMAPEQAGGRIREVDSRTDLWAVGATMFAFLSGAFVHEGDTPEELMLHTATRPARKLASVAHEVPAVVGAVVDRALAFEANERWPSAMAMRDALAEAYQRATGSAVPTPPPAEQAALEPSVHSLVTEAAVEAHCPSPCSHERELGVAPSNAAERVSEPKPKPRGTITKPHRRLGMWIALSFVVVGVSSVTLLHATSIHPQRVPPASTTSAMPVSAGAMPPVFGLLPETPERGHIQAALQAWFDASLDAMQDELSKAFSLNENSAPAHFLYLFGSVWTDDIMRRHYQNAYRHRVDLPEPARVLLESLSPCMTEAPDLEACELRLAAALARYPDYPLLRYQLVLTRLKLGSIRRAFEPLDELPADADIAAFWELRGLAHALADEKDDARRALGRCLELSPSASACLRRLALLDGHEGDCVSMEKWARRLIATNDEYASSYLVLVRALVGRSAPTENVRQVLEQRWARLDASVRPEARAEDEARLALVSGEFAVAREQLRRWRDLASRRTDEQTNAVPAELAMLLELELGASKAAIDLANDFEARRSAMIGGGFLDYGILPIRVKHLAQGIGDADYRRRRDEWVEAELVRGFAVDRGLLWMRAYAQTARTAEEAREALALTEQYQPLTSAMYRSADQDYALGGTYLSAGELDAALPHLYRGARSCSGFDWPLHVVWNICALGDALAQKGDVGGACQAYGDVLSRWPSGSQSRTRMAAQAGYGQLRCGGKAHDTASRLGSIERH